MKIFQNRKIKYDDFKIVNPILKTEIQNNEQLKNLSILKQSQGTNFKVTPDEWKALYLLLNEKIRRHSKNISINPVSLNKKQEKEQKEEETAQKLSDSELLKRAQKTGANPLSSQQPLSNIIETAMSRHM